MDPTFKEVFNVLQWVLQIGFLGALFKIGKVSVEVRDNFRDIYKAICGDQFQDGLIKRVTRNESRNDDHERRITRLETKMGIGKNDTNP